MIRGCVRVSMGGCGWNGALGARLSHEARDDAEEARVIVEVGLNELLEACCADGSEVLGDEDCERLVSRSRMKIEACAEVGLRARRGEKTEQGAQHPSRMTCRRT